MNIVERGKASLQWLREVAGRSAWDWRHCPRCGNTLTCKWGTYDRHPWCFEGRRTIAVQRHMCRRCCRSYSESSALLVRGSWYAREVHRCAVDHWQHVGTSLRRTAEVLRSWMGRQERYHLWRPLHPAAAQSERCSLAASTVHRWLDQAGRVAQESVQGQLEGIPSSGAVGVDGLWARLRGGGKRVVLLVVDSVSGLMWPPVVVEGEESEAPWEQLFQRARQAGLKVDQLRGVTSDRAKGLLAYLRRGLSWIQHQSCVWHVWHSLGRELASAAAAAAEGLAEEAARQVGESVRRELVALVRGVIDAPSYEAAEQAVATLRGHPQGARIGHILNMQLDHLLAHLVAYYHGLQRVAPEWCWRDFRLRLSRGRNHGSEQRLERAALVWAIYHNFTPAQWRSERKRHYRHPGQSPLTVAGVPPGEISYLDALGV